MLLLQEFFSSEKRTSSRLQQLDLLMLSVTYEGVFSRKTRKVDWSKCLGGLEHVVRMFGLDLVYSWVVLAGWTLGWELCCVKCVSVVAGRCVRGLAGVLVMCRGDREMCWLGSWLFGGQWKEGTK